MAQMGKKVILVDTDLRRPTLHTLFNLHQEPGLTNVIMGETPTLEAAIVDTKIPGLRVLPSGTIPPNPAEILSTRWLDNMIETLKQQADIVLFDSPPVLPVTDAALLAAKTGNLLWVIGAGATRSDMLRKAREALGQVDAKILGVVLNKLAVRRGGYGYYYYNYYYAKDGHEKKRKKEAASSKRLLPLDTGKPPAARMHGNGSEAVETAPEKI